MVSFGSISILFSFMYLMPALELKKIWLYPTIMVVLWFCYIKTQLQQIMLLNKKQILLHSTLYPVILFDKYKIVDKLFQIKSVLYYIKKINYLSTLNCKKHAKAKFAKTMPCQYTFLSFALRIQKLTTAWIGVYHLFCLIYRFEAKLMVYLLDIK